MGIHAILGERQRLAICRTLLAKPFILLADEPVASLDSKWADRVLKFLRETMVQTGGCLICSLHDESQVNRFADQRLHLDSPFPMVGPYSQWEERFKYELALPWHSRFDLLGVTFLLFLAGALGSIPGIEGAGRELDHWGNLLVLLPNFSSDWSILDRTLMD